MKKNLVLILIIIMFSSWKKDNFKSFDDTIIFINKTITLRDSISYNSNAYGEYKLDIEKDNINDITFRIENIDQYSNREKICKIIFENDYFSNYQLSDMIQSWETPMGTETSITHEKIARIYNYEDTINGNYSDSSLELFLSKYKQSRNGSYYFYDDLMGWKFKGNKYIGIRNNDKGINCWIKINLVQDTLNIESYKFVYDSFIIAGK